MHGNGFFLLSQSCVGCTLVRLFKVIGSIVLGAVFFGLVTPISICYRLMGRDVLNLKLYSTKKSYWIERIRASKVPEGFFSQFISK